MLTQDAEVQYAEGVRDAACRRVNDTHVDDTFVPISVPTFTAGAAPPKRDLSTSYFFVRVEPAKAPGDGAGDAAPTVAPGAGVRAGSTTSSGPWRGDSATSLSSLRSLQRSLACQQLQGLELGVPIAAGSYGRVFKGTYQGETVSGWGRRLYSSNAWVVVVTLWRFFGSRALHHPPCCLSW